MMMNQSMRNHLKHRNIFSNQKENNIMLTYPIEENSSSAAGDVESLSVTRLNHKVTDLTMHLSPRRGVAAI